MRTCRFSGEPRGPIALIRVLRNIHQVMQVGCGSQEPEIPRPTARSDILRISQDAAGMMQIMASIPTIKMES